MPAGVAFDGSPWVTAASSAGLGTFDCIFAALQSQACHALAQFDMLSFDADDSLIRFNQLQCW
jgi:hypothetical protein